MVEVVNECWAFGFAIVVFAWFIGWLMGVTAACLFPEKRAGMNYREEVRMLVDKSKLVFDTRNDKTGWFCTEYTTEPIAYAESEDHLPGQLRALLQIAEDVDF